MHCVTLGKLHRTSLEGAALTATCLLSGSLESERTFSRVGIMDIKKLKGSSFKTSSQSHMSRLKFAHVNPILVEAC